MAYTLTTAIILGQSQVGLSLKAALVDSTGAILASPHRDIATGFTEFGLGTYQFTYSSTPDGHRGSVVFYTGTVGAGSNFSGVTVKAAAGINPEELEYTNVKTDSRSTLTQTQVTGGAYPLDTDANGRVRVVDGTEAGEIDTNAGKVSLAASQSFDNTGQTTALPATEATLQSRLTASRAGYLDNLNVGGAVASSAEVTAIQNNTRVVLVVPEQIERPDSGTFAYLIHIYLYDTAGNMEAPDSAPTVALTNQAGTDLSARLGSTTGTFVGSGHYKWTYTASTSDALEQLLWEFTVTEGGLTRIIGRQSLIVDTTAADFTSGDRTKLEAVFNKLPSKTYLTGSNNSDGDVQMDEATGNYPGTVATVTTLTNAPPDSAGVTTLLARIGAFTGTGLNTVLGFFRALLRKDAALTPSDVGGTFDNTTDSQEAERDNFDAVMTAIKGGSWSTETLKAIYDLIGTRLATSAYTVPPTAEQIEDQVWDAPASEHNAALSMGAKVNAAGSGADPLQNTKGDYVMPQLGAIIGNMDLARVTAHSAVFKGKNIKVVHGDDYLQVLGTALRWTEDTDAWPDLSAAGTVVKFSIKTGSATVFTKDAIIIDATGPTKEVRVELAHDDFDDIPADVKMKYDLEAQIGASGYKVTIVGPFDENGNRIWFLAESGVTP